VIGFSLMKMGFWADYPETRGSAFFIKF
jgi:hypothetical protein